MADTLRAAAYRRVSTGEQADSGTSLEAQRERCENYIRSKDWTLVGDWADAGVSGALASRPQLDDLLDRCRFGEIDVIVCTSLDRFSRSVRQLSNAVDELDALGVSVVFIREGLDGSTPTGRFLRTTLGACSELERDMIAERTALGHLAMARQGYWPSGPPPHGYKLAPRDGHKVAVVNEAEAEPIRIAVAILVDEFGSVADAVARLNALGFTRREGTRWNSSQLRRRLLQDHWSGAFVWHRGKADEIVIDIPPVLTAERHTQLRAALLRTSTGPRNRIDQAVYPLSGRIRSECGSVYTGVYRNDRDVRYYRCRNRTSDRAELLGARCADKTMRADAIEEAAKSAVRDLFDRDYLRVLASEAMASRQLQATVEQGQLADARKKVEAVEQGLAAAYADLYGGRGDRRSLSLAIATLETDLGALRALVAQLETWHLHNAAAETRFRALEELADAAATRLATLEPREWGHLFELLQLELTVEERGSRGAITRVRVEGVLHDRLDLTGLSGTSGPELVQGRSRGFPFGAGLDFRLVV